MSPNILANSCHAYMISPTYAFLVIIPHARAYTAVGNSLVYQYIRIKVYSIPPPTNNILYNIMYYYLGLSKWPSLK